MSFCKTEKIACMVNETDHVFITNQAGDTVRGRTANRNETASDDQEQTQWSLQRQGLSIGHAIPKGQMG